MRKIFSFSLSLILLLQIFLLSTVKAAAVSSCPVTTSPVTTNEKFVDLTINTSGLLPDGNTYWVKLDNNIVQTIGKGGNNFTPSNGIISVQHVNPQGYTNPLNNDRTFEARGYTVSVQEPQNNGTVFCSSSFTPEYKASGGTCGIHFTNTSFTIKDDISINATSLGGNPVDGRRVVVKRSKENGEEIYSECTNVSTLSSNYTIKKFEAGVYYLEIRSGCDPAASKSCFTPFAVGAKGGFGPSPGPIATPPPICKGGFCETALGKIFTDPANFVKNFFGILLSLAGGIAIILIIISGYRLMASGGNPEKVQAAREQLTSAIVGLLFIIFSLSILQIVGVDILHIPGLTK